MTVNIEKLNLHINRLKEIDSRYSEQNADILSEIASELQKIISFLVNQDQSKWDSIYSGIFYTKNHIEDLHSKGNKSRVEAYKFGCEQTLGDLEDIRDRLLDQH